MDMIASLRHLRRPRLLIRAARIGLAEYNRDPYLRRVLGQASLPRSAPALRRLIEIEADLDHKRRTEDAGYSVSRHVEVLMAMMGEAQLLRNVVAMTPAA